MSLQKVLGLLQPDTFDARNYRSCPFSFLLENILRICIIDHFPKFVCHMERIKIFPEPGNLVRVGIWKVGAWNNYILAS